MATLTSITNANALKWATQKKEVLEKAGVIPAPVHKLEPAAYAAPKQNWMPNDLHKPSMPENKPQGLKTGHWEIEEARKSLRLLKSKMSSGKRPLTAMSGNMPIQAQRGQQYERPPTSFAYEMNQRNSSPIRGNQPFGSEYQKQGPISLKNEKAPLNTRGVQETAMDRPIPVLAKAPKNEDPDEEGDEGELIECPEGCGRRFNEVALVKHQKVCKKVFQTQRPQFDAAAMRVVSDDQANLQVKQKKPDKAQAKKKAEADSKKAKWAAQSEAFRAQMKAARGETMSKEEQQALQTAQDHDLTKCPHCSRKFNEKAASRHIPFCEQKTKQDKMKNAGGSKKNDAEMGTQALKKTANGFMPAKPTTGQGRRDIY